MIIASPTIALAGVLAVALPITIHLFFRRRQRPVEWAAMELLREAIKRTSQRQRLQRLALLALRCLIVAATGLAVAGPLFQSDERASMPGGATQHELVIVLDDGVAQQATIDDTESFETSQTLALEAIDSLKPGDSVGIVLAAGARPLVWPPSTDLRAARVAVSGLTAAHEPSMIPAALATVMTPDRSPCIISAFRRGTFADGGTLVSVASKATITLSSPETSDAPNVQLTSLEAVARGPNTSRDLVPMRITLRREGGQLPPTTTLLETSAGDSRTTSRVEWSLGQSEAATEIFVQVSRSQTADLPVRASITERDAQQADNARFAVVMGTPVIRVCVIDREQSLAASLGSVASTWIDRALRPTDTVGIEIESIDPATVDAARLVKFDASIITRPDLLDARAWEVVARAVDGGLVVIVVPWSEASNSTWSDGMVGAFNLGWTIAREARSADTAIGIALTKQPPRHLSQIAAELPELTQPVLVERWFAVTIPAGRGQPVLSLEDGSPFIVEATLEQARGSLLFVASAIDLEWTNLPAKPLMVPLLQELVRQAVASVARGGEIGVGAQQIQHPPKHAESIVIALADARVDVNEVRSVSLDPTGTLAHPIMMAGVYEARDAAGHGVGWVVANISVDAASIQTTPHDDLAAHFPGSSVTITTGSLANSATVADRSVSSGPQIPIAPALDGQSLATAAFIVVIALLVGEALVARLASTGSSVVRALERPR
ncbi:MAG: hypothetical protein EXS03_07935 [Phycisphaerales bacterium]|nr:hypothetical protein [Phycisphaerales bacterium]